MDIRIKDLPFNAAPTKNLLIPTDLASAGASTVEALVLSGRPTASQAEAEAGTEAVKAMTPLTTAQAIEALALVPDDVGVQVQAYATQLADLSSNLLKTTKTGGIDYGIDIARTVTGTSAIGVNSNLINITADNADITGPNFLNGMTIQHTWGGGQGGRQAQYVLSNQTSATKAENENRNYVAGGATITTTGDGGVSLTEVTFTGTTTNASAVVTVANTTGLIVGMTVFGTGMQGGTTILSIVANTSITLSKNATASGATSLLGRGPRGAYFAYAYVAHAKPGATNLLQMGCSEVNVIMDPGSSTRHKVGWSIVGHEADSVEGFATNAMLLFGNQGPTILWRDGILFSDINGYFPIKSTGSLLRSVTGTVLDAIDLSAVTASGSLFKGPSVRIKDTIGLAIYGGSGTVVVQPNGANVMSFTGTSGGDTQIVLNGQGAGAPPFFVTSGPATDIDFIIRAQGAGTLDVDFPTATTVGAAGAATALPATPVGYITVKVSGTARKIPFYNT